MHLTVEVILYVIPEVGHLLVGFGQRIWPCLELCRTIQVTIVAELCVWLQPKIVVFTELLVGSSTFYCCPFLLEQYVQIVKLCAEHALIVNLRQGIQLLT